MALSDVIGHARIVEAFVAAHARGAVHHAHLLAGPAGVGKRVLARAFIALVNCSGRPSRDPAGRAVEPCGECRSCRHVLADREHPDVLRLGPEEGSRTIKIAQVREILRIVPFPPIEAPSRFVVIEPADRLTEEAANALLKSLEEPSSHTRFLVISDRPDALLSTIRSRCQQILFGRLSDEEVVRVLVERLDVDADSAAAVAPLADGSPGAAIGLLDDPVMAQRDVIVRRLTSIRAGDVGEAFALASDLAELKPVIHTVFDVLQRFYRDALLVRTGSDPAVALANPHLRSELIEPLAARYGTEALLHRLALLVETERGIVHRNLNAKLSMERLVLALTAPPGEEGASPGLLDRA